MFYVIDISWVRKCIQNKYNGIMLDCKLSPPKVNRALVVAVVAGTAILVGSTINAAGVIDKAQYNFLLDHYVSDLKYPKGLAEKLIHNLTVTDFQELYARVSHHDKFTNNGGNQLLNIGNEFGSTIVKGIKALLTLYN